MAKCKVRDYSCERLSRNRINASLVSHFLSRKSLELMIYIKSTAKKNSAWIDDRDNKKAVYLVKENNKIVGYFSLQCGLLVKCNSKQISGIGTKDSQGTSSFFVNGNEIDVSEVIPAIELTHFCINDAYRMKRPENIKCGLSEYSLGEYIFYRFIATRVLNIADQAGMRVLYLYCADDPLHRLSNYYVNRLHFSKIDKMSCLRPEYDEDLDCYTMSVDDLRKNVAQFKDQSRIRIVLNYIHEHGAITISQAKKECCILEPYSLFEFMVDRKLAKLGKRNKERGISRLIANNV